MSTLTEIQRAITKLAPGDKRALPAWLSSQDEGEMTEMEEAALQASLDRAARELDEGKGVPIEQVRQLAHSCHHAPSPLQISQ